MLFINPHLLKKIFIIYNVQFVRFTKFGINIIIITASKIDQQLLSFITSELKWDFLSVLFLNSLLIEQFWLEKLMWVALHGGKNVSAAAPDRLNYEFYNHWCLLSAEIDHFYSIKKKLISLSTTNKPADCKLLWMLLLFSDSHLSALERGGVWKLIARSVFSFISAKSHTLDLLTAD